MRGQQTVQGEEDGLVRAKNNVSIILQILLPDGIQEGYIMREYLGSEKFPEETLGLSDREKMDEIYLDAMDLSQGSETSGLLAAAFGVFEHKTIPLDLFGLIIQLPLTSESQLHFDTRVSHLPSHLYSPAVGDIDKLQHFFSSAWLKSALGMDWLVNLAGNFVEIGEEAFVLGGSNDPRDKHANHDGLRFGNHLGEWGIVLPSEFLTPNP